MKQYDVLTIPSVHDRIMQSYRYIHNDSPANALAWLHGCYQAIASLKTMPARCGRIREQGDFSQEYRELLYDSHRIIFTIDEPSAVVQIVDLRHAAQDAWRADDK